MWEIEHEKGLTEYEKNLNEAKYEQLVEALRQDYFQRALYMFRATTRYKPDKNTKSTLKTRAEVLEELSASERLMDTGH